MLVLLIVGWTLGLMFKSGGTQDVGVSPVAAVLSSRVLVLVFLLFALLAASWQLRSANWSFAALAIPFIMAVSRLAQLLNIGLVGGAKRRQCVQRMQIVV